MGGQLKYENLFSLYFVLKFFSTAWDSTGDPSHILTAFLLLFEKSELNFEFEIEGLLHLKSLESTNDSSAAIKVSVLVKLELQFIVDSLSINRCVGDELFSVLVVNSLV